MGLSEMTSQTKLKCVNVGLTPALHMDIPLTREVPHIQESGKRNIELPLYNGYFLKGQM